MATSNMNKIYKYSKLFGLLKVMEIARYHLALCRQARMFSRICQVLPTCAPSKTCYLGLTHVCPCRPPPSLWHMEW